MQNLQNLQNQNKETHYTTLGILPSASHDEIKKIYRKLSLEYHPDRNSGDRNTAEIYKKINEAYRVLSDEQERRQYDMVSSLSTGIDPSQIMSMFFDKNVQAEAQSIMNEFVNMPFFGLGSGLFKNLNLNPNLNQNLNKFKNSGNGFSQNQNYNQCQMKPPTIARSLNINLHDAFTGCKIPISITRWIIDDDRKSDQTETLYIDVPKGVDDNEIITLVNKGNRASDDNRGNVEVTVSVNRHLKFERNGIDLIYKKSITLKESFCGFSFDLAYIDGRVFKINNAAGNIIPVGFQKIIAKMGMARDDDVGNLIIVFDIVYPKEFSAAQIEELERIL